MELLDELEAAAAEANVVALSAAASACEAAARWGAALGALGALRRRGLEAEVILCSTLVSACGRSSFWQPSIELLAEMQQASIRRNTQSFNAATSACHRSLQWGRASAMLAAIWKTRAEPDIVSHNAAISACERAGEWQAGLVLLLVLFSTSLEADALTYNSAIGACAKGRQWEWTLEALARARLGLGLRGDSARGHALGGRRRGPPAPGGPGTVACSVAVAACEAAGRWRRALGLLRGMKRDSTPPDVFAEDAAISACERGLQVEAGLRLLSGLPRCAGELRRRLGPRRALPRGSRELPHAGAARRHGSRGIGRVGLLASPAACPPRQGGGSGRERARSRAGSAARLGAACRPPLRCPARAPPLAALGAEKGWGGSSGSEWGPGLDLCETCDGCPCCGKPKLLRAATDGHSARN